MVGAILVAVLLPWLVASALNPSDADLIRNTMLANGVAILCGYYMYQSVTIYPGVQASYFILPTFSAAYALVILGLLFSRLHYNRIYLAVGFALCLIWYYGVTLLAQRRQPLRIAVVPFGEMQALYEIKRVNWLRLDAPDSAQAGACDALVADFRADLPDEWERFLADATLAGLAVLHVKELRESLTGRVQIDHLSENNFGSLIPDHAYLRVKQVVDFVTALIMIVLLSPFLVIVAAAIRLDSSGPALYRQKRVGYAGRVFTVYKFRTMRHAPSEQSDRRMAITEDDDPRVTRLGRFLRRSRIDELPQLINILRGEMSWIGPRPEAQILSEWYEQEIPFYRYRHIVRPGITGWAQVNQGHVAEVGEVFGKLQYDFYYIRRFSPWLDALIVARTILTMASGFGSR
ncbi:sugar transferase [Sphingosinicella sp. LY1275]|uniref:sugar transferase n=1 Tax=Sphingosinicella sp. LY1275 TaxID=3095379 RepID=UPI002ADEF748|nr:sugar transferase [Sphingosinicella sp. LY1275]MEA1014468.1 sugar transferase [Sphingosinicella sp. LY1275]